MFLYILLGKLIILFSNLFNFGSGSTWPGHLINYFDKDLISKIIKKNPHLKIIFIIGTNGKTTTTSLIAHILKKLNFKVFYNYEGANLLNGILSSFIKKIKFTGYLDYDYAIFEIDEFSFPIVYEKLKPDYLLILNLFRDQLDRYGEVNTIANKWFETLKKSKKLPVLIINGDDPNLFFLGKKLNGVFFGLNEKLMRPNQNSSDKDFVYCPSCNQILTFKKISYSHLGNYYCSKCQFKKNFNNIFDDNEIKYPLKGLYNVYNINAVITLIKLIDKNINEEKINQFLIDFKPAFGRQEKIKYQGKEINLYLVKNPAGFNQTIETINKDLNYRKGYFLVVLNNRIPDGKDVSWIWDVDIKNLLKNIKKVYISGDRLYDMSLRFIYENVNIKKKIFTEENLRKAINDLIKKSNINDKIYFLMTYSAMLQVRKILLGKKFI